MRSKVHLIIFHSKWVRHIANQNVLFLQFTCNGTIKQSIIAVAKLFIRVSTALCLKHTRVRAVPISFDAPLELVAASAIFWNASKYTDIACIVALDLKETERNSRIGFIEVWSTI